MKMEQNNMLAKFLTEGMRIELQAVSQNYEGILDNQERIYQSRIHEILSEDTLEILMPMEKQKLILRYNRPGNNRDVYYKLTEQGKRVFDCHYAYHEARSARIYSIFRSYTPEEQELVLRFLHDYGEYLNDYL